VFEGKYSTLIDMREFEAMMSDHHITMIARGIYRLSAPRLSAKTAAALEGPFAVSLRSERISVLPGAQKPVKMAEAA
jgi:hypothetical protein